MEDILKIAAATVVTAVYAVVVKQRAQEVGLVPSLTAGALVLTMALGAVKSVRALMDELDEAASLPPVVLAPTLKTVGIATLIHTSAEVCRDAKENGVAVSVETMGIAVALCVALPLLWAMLDTVAELL